MTLMSLWHTDHISAASPVRKFDADEDVASPLLGLDSIDYIMHVLRENGVRWKAKCSIVRRAIAFDMLHTLGFELRSTV